MSVTPSALYPLILDSITEAVFTVDAQFNLTYLNAEAERITGARAETVVGRKCYEVLRGSRCQSGCPLRRSIETGRPQRDVKVTMLDAAMEPVPLLVSTAAMVDGDGTLVGGVEVFRDISELETLRRKLTAQAAFGEIVVASPEMKRLFGLLPDVATSEASVMIQGDSGTGKELVARAIHDLSPRASAPFVQVNCGALPDTLLESELFGHVRGAFTDARRDRSGRFQQADGGTLFLDEVGDLSPAFQVKLLRALQEGEIQPLGSTHTIHVDVRVISATNRDLPALVARGGFREDLYYRLCVVPLTIPPLSERRQDIIPLIEHYVGRLASRTGKPISGVSEAALAALCDYDYPGNVRELVNILERAFVMCHGTTIELAHLPQDVISARLAVVGAASGGLGRAPLGRPAGRLKPSERRVLDLATTEAAPPPPAMPPEARALLDALQDHGWNRKATSRALGISRSTLWRRMRDYGLL